MQSQIWRPASRGAGGRVRKSVGVKLLNNRRIKKSKTANVSSSPAQAQNTILVRMLKSARDGWWDRTKGISV